MPEEHAPKSRWFGYRAFNLWGDIVALTAYVFLMDFTMTGTITGIVDWQPGKRYQLPSRQPLVEAVPHILFTIRKCVLWLKRKYTNVFQDSWTSFDSVSAVSIYCSRYAVLWCIYRSPFCCCSSYQCKVGYDTIVLQWLLRIMGHDGEEILSARWKNSIGTKGYCIFLRLIIL